MGPPRTPEGKSLRLFVALDLPEEVRDGIANWGGRELRDPALRVVGPAALHVTLCFLGRREEADADRVAHILASVPRGPVELRLDPAPQPIPPRRPRLFALDAPSETATELQAALARELEGAGFYAPEKRPFRPHVTVARVRPERGRRGAPQRVARPPGTLPDGLLRPFGAVRVALYRSDLRPTGAEYVSLAGFDLAPPQAQKR
jgi:2'-5' RNA ligase